MLKRKYALKLTRRGLSGLILIFFFGVIWMFVLGIFVGRKSVPVRFHIKDIKKELASLKNSDEKVEKPSEDTVISEKKEGLGFYEDLKENESPKSPKVKPPSDKQKIIKKSFHEKAATINTVKTEKEKKSETVKSEKSFTIQVSSVKDEATADRLVAELKKQGYSAYKTRVNIPNLGIWHRVRIGHYRSKDKATPTIEGLKKKAFQPILLQE
jgi:cell division septation protein DedD